MHECAYCLLKSETEFEFLEFTRCIEMCRIDATLRWVLFRQNEHASFLINSTPGFMNFVANYYEHANTNSDIQVRIFPLLILWILWRIITNMSTTTLDIQVRIFPLLVLWILWRIITNMPTLTLIYRYEYFHSWFYEFCGEFFRTCQH
jgi:hypothetical protein